MLKEKVMYLSELVLLPLTILVASIILSYSMLQSRDNRLYQISAINNSAGTVIYRLNLQTGKIAGCVPKIISYPQGAHISDQYTDFNVFDQFDFGAPENGKLIDNKTPPLVHQVVFNCSGFLPNSPNQ